MLYKVLHAPKLQVLLKIRLIVRAKSPWVGYIQVDADLGDQ